MQTLFHSGSTKNQLDFEKLIKQIASYVKSSPNSHFRITVGTDSPGVTNPFFVTAVTVLKVGNGGRYFWTKSERIKCHTLQERIYKETLQSITLSQELKSRLKDELGEEFFWPASPAGKDNQITIHIDVGEKGPTREFVEGVVGMVKGYGLEAVIKPFSFCAFVVADRHT